MNKVCPNCKKELGNAIFYGIDVDYCPKCLGVWFEEDELRWAKDLSDRNLTWLDIDLWKDDEKFKISRDKKLCPECRLPLYEVNYGTSRIMVDVCNVCHGIWLDRGEFEEIIKYLKEEGNYEVLNKFTKKLLGEFWEIFSGPEDLREEVSDFLAILKLLKYKFATQNLAITKLISSLPK
ncbi:MAG: zf-TFIIB domain-containing protein [Candidatus Pacebacteria bacterium]|nr:zf-TFIIB domain-containing protein [Candidatus Paceibacterota bacterium]